MGDENSLQSGTVAHKHTEPSSDGSQLDVTTLMQGMPLTAYIQVMS